MCPKSQKDFLQHPGWPLHKIPGNLLRGIVIWSGAAQLSLEFFAQQVLVTFFSLSQLETKQKPFFAINVGNIICNLFMTS